MLRSNPTLAETKKAFVNTRSDSKPLIDLPLTDVLKPNVVKDTKSDETVFKPEVVLAEQNQIEDSSITAGEDENLIKIFSENNNISESNSSEMLSSSSIFSHSPFDTQIFDDSMSDDFAPMDYIKCLTNINYDIEYSDNSTENSTSEDIDATNKKKIESRNLLSETAMTSLASVDLDEFDPLKNTSDKTANSNTQVTATKEAPSIAPAAASNMSNYRGFSNFDIPTISCNMGDFGSLNQSNSELLLENSMNKEAGNQLDANSREH